VDIEIFPLFVFLLVTDISFLYYLFDHSWTNPVFGKLGVYVKQVFVVIIEVVVVNVFVFVVPYDILLVMSFIYHLFYWSELFDQYI
jgi:hypothetical protein